MALEPHWRHAARTIGSWLEPPWRRERPAERRALAWAATGASLACYLFAFLTLGAGAGSGIASLYALPCLVAGWAFGSSGGLLVGLLGVPLHAWILTSGVVPPDDQGPIGALFGVFSATAVAVSVGAARDLRERLRERGDELAASEDRYRQLVDNSPEGVLVHERGVIVFANPSMSRLAGTGDASALVGRTLVTLAPFEDREALAANFVFASHHRRGPRTVEARLARPDGETVEVVMAAMPIHYRGSRASLVLVREACLVREPARIALADPPRASP